MFPHFINELMNLLAGNSRYIRYSRPARVLFVLLIASFILISLLLVLFVPFATAGGRTILLSVSLALTQQPVFMPDPTLQKVYEWAKAQRDRPVMLGYKILKINGQVPNTVLLLLKLPEYKRPIAEIQIEFVPIPSPIYKVFFDFLPFNPECPRPSHSKVNLTSIEQVILWIQDGQHHGPIPSVGEAHLPKPEPTEADEPIAIG